jgi:hypothetical protein
VYIWVGPDGSAQSMEKKARPKHGMARNILVSGRGRGPWVGTSTARLRQARNGPYRSTKRPIYLLKSDFIPHFHVLDKEHKARDNVN